MSTQQQSETTWWEQDGPIPGLNSPEEPMQPMVVRQAEQHAPARSEYAELAALAQAAGPRDPTRLLAEAKRVGQLLGSRAYYDFPAGGGRVTGPSIGLMDALAVVWGRLLQSVSIVSETTTRVHLRGRVLDLYAVTAVERDYVSAIAPAPGKFAAKPDQADRWRVMQLQSASSKAVRGALEHALPAWLTDAALAAAHAAVAYQATGGKSLAEARAAAVDVLGRSGLTVAHLQAYVDGQPADLWTVDELTRLRTLARDLHEGRVAVEAVRASIQLQVATAQPVAPTGDRLAGLGLSSSQPAPTTTSSSPSPSTSEAGVGTPAAPASGDDQAADKAPDPVRVAALDRLKAYRAADEAVVARVGRKHGLVSVGRTSTDRLLPLLDEVARELTPLPATMAAVGDVEVCLSTEAVTAAAQAAGVDLEAGPASEAAALAYLAALTEQA